MEKPKEPFCPIEFDNQAFVQNTPTQSMSFAQQPLVYPETLVQIVNQLLGSESGRAQLQIENHELKQKAERKLKTEDSYQKILQSGNQLVTFDPLGRPVILMNRTVRSVCHFVPAPPFKLRESYVVELENVDRILILSREDFFSDSKLLQALQELPGVQVTLLKRSRRLTADALRKVFAEKTQSISPAFYGGWQRAMDGSYQFMLSSEKNTHGLIDKVATYQPVRAAPNLAESSIAFENLMKAVAPICDPCERWFATCCLHLCNLSSLIENLGFSMPKALCLQFDAPSIAAFFKRLFCWYGDKAVSLSDPTDVLLQAILERKDEPFVICEGTTHAAAQNNIQLLRSVIDTHQIPWKVSKERTFFPLRATPVILTSTASAFSCTPGCLALELQAEGFDLSHWNSVCNAIDKYVEEYFLNFNCLMVSNVSFLRQLLKEGEKTAFERGDNDLSSDATQALGLLLAMDRCIREYVRTISSRLNAQLLSTEEWDHWLFTYCKATAENDFDHTVLAGQFASVGRAMIQERILPACTPERDTISPRSGVFVGEDFVFFSKEAFQLVCQRMALSKTKVLLALRDARLITGRPINDETCMTRISTWPVHGIRQTVRGYKMPREVFEQLGDPLNIEGEEL